MKKTGLTLLLIVGMAGGCCAEFIHPGGLHTQADLDRMKVKVAAEESPWIDGWNLLIKDRKAQSDYQASPHRHMASRQRAQDDASAAYLNTLRWIISAAPARRACGTRGDTNRRLDSADVEQHREQPDRRPPSTAPRSARLQSSPPTPRPSPTPASPQARNTPTVSAPVTPAAIRPIQTKQPVCNRKRAQETQKPIRCLLRSRRSFAVICPLLSERQRSEGGGRRPST